MDRFKNIFSWSDENGVINYFFIKKIEKLNYIGDYNRFMADLTLYLVKEISDNDLNKVVFRNITSAKLDLSLAQLAGLAVEDISDRGLEKRNYKIYTYESDDIDFTCEEIEITNNATLS